MFRASYLFTFAVLVLLGPVAAVQAQTETQVRSGDVIAKRDASKITWSEPSDPSTVDPLSLCVTPFPAKMVPAKKAITSGKKTTKRTAPKMTLTPGAKAYPRIATSKPTRVLPKQPQLQCPQVEMNPTMMGTLDSVESVIPMPGDALYAIEAPEMPLVNARAFPNMGNVATAAKGAGMKWGPLIWLFGGGAGIATFSQFLDDDSNRGYGRTRYPLGPNPPSIANPELPPITTTPEPGTMILVGTGLAGIVGAYRRRPRK